MAFLQGDVKVPGIKQPLPKWGVLGGLAATGIGIYVYYRNRQNSASAAAASGTADTGSLGLASGDLGTAVAGAGGGTDPYPWDGTYSNPGDPYSLDTATGTTFGDEGGTAPVSGTAGPPFSSNAAWSAYAQQQLTQTAGMDPATVAEALGLYLNGQVLDANEQSIVYAAIGVAGAVPVRGSGGYPPTLRKSPSGSKGGTVFADNPVKGLKAKPGTTSVTISWDKADHATGYQLSMRNISKGRNAGSATTAHTTFTFTGLTRGDRFEASVLAKPAAKGAQAATIDAAPIALLPGKKG